MLDINSIKTGHISNITQNSLTILFQISNKYLFPSQIYNGGVKVPIIIFTFVFFLEKIIGINKYLLMKIW